MARQADPAGYRSRSWELVAGTGVGAGAGAGVGCTGTADGTSLPRPLQRLWPANYLLNCQRMCLMSQIAMPMNVNANANVSAGQRNVTLGGKSGEGC